MGEWRIRARDGGMENKSKGLGEWRTRARDGGIGDCSETGSLMEGEGKQGPVSLPASLWTSGIKRRSTT